MRNLFHSFVVWFAVRFMVPTVPGWESRWLQIDAFSDYNSGNEYMCMWVRGAYPNMHCIYYHETCVSRA